MFLAIIPPRSGSGFPRALLPGSLDYFLIETVLDPEASLRADLVQLGAQRVNSPFQSCSDEDSDGARFLNPKGRRNSPCVGLVQERETTLVLDRKGDDLGFPFVELVPE